MATTAPSRAYKAKGDRSQTNIVTAVESRITPQLIGLPIQGCRMSHMWKAGTHNTSLPLQPIPSVQEDREETVKDSLASGTRGK